MNTNPLSPPEIERQEEIAGAHEFDGLSSTAITESDRIATYTRTVDRLLDVYREINRTPSSDEDELDALLSDSDFILDSVLSQKDYLNTLLWNAGHKIIDGDFEHDIIVSFSNEFGRIVKLTWFNR